MLQLDGFPTGDAVKADRSAGRLTGSMMELQTLQEALKVEIQIHQKLVSQMKQDPQNADLKKQLHELQANITALSEKQKKVVEQLRKELMKQEPEGKLYLQTPAGGDVKQSPQQHIAKLAGRKQSPEEVLVVLAEDIGADIYLVDSASDGEDLLQPERRPHSRHSHHDVPPVESDEEYDPKMASAPTSHPQPSSSSPGSESPKDTQSKGKGKASSNLMKRVRRSPRGGSPALRWRSREEKDRGPEPRRFMPARVPGPALDPSAPSPPPLTCMPMYYGEDGTQSRRYCRRCRDAGYKRVKTPVYCRKCQVPLCLTAKKNCFTEWHD
ncbi:uncharacterized protein LOC117559797 isoform X1 [Gymnodraco acuticeps]|uniref:Uncharacterized protein LOC117559797 isoform X1 n=1 Tax=Gymnodraco acuticeps TaxID=8218 RepID=A0A6P8W266_GYMAC|nr:uncharacterized protein LOC117559797 isoform X1 [Gymnodraco acuticeps]